MQTKIDRSQVVIAKRDVLDNMDAEYWERASIKKKLQAITYLRECFYGKEATTRCTNERHSMDARRLQRVCTVLKLK